ncbi:Gfo/Idh/MocA family protein [Candidatus Poribacteria bacterium]
MSSGQQKLKVGILGLRRGITHLRNFLNVEDAEVIACADRAEVPRERAREIIGDRPVKIVNEFEELLDLKPDAIAIATNGRLQAEHSIQAMEAGCHVMSEVPGAFTQEEIVHIVAVAERTDKQYMLAENSCFLDFLRYWRKWILEDRFGAISIADGEYLHYLPHTMLTPDGSSISPTKARTEGRNDVVPTWRSDQPPIQYLTHDLGPLLNVLNDRVISVTCKDGPWWQVEAPLRADGQIGLFHTAKGALIRIMVTLNTRRPGAHNYRIFGTLGSTEWYSHEGFCRRLDRDRGEREGWERVDIGSAARDDDKSSGHGGTDIKTAYYFTKAILAGKTVPIDVYRMSDFTLPGIIAARSAELGGQPLTVPDIRRKAFEGTDFWEHVGLPEEEPEGRDYVSDMGTAF